MYKVHVVYFLGCPFENFVNPHVSAPSQRDGPRNVGHTSEHHVDWNLGFHPMLLFTEILYNEERPHIIYSLEARNFMIVTVLSEIMKVTTVYPIFPSKFVSGC